MTLTKFEKQIINYAQFCYGGSYWVKDGYLHISIGHDRFYINLKDKQRFDKYQVMHRNAQRHVDGKTRFHTQMYAYNLPYAIFTCFTHEFNKNLNIMNTQEDFFYFKKDAILYNITD